jgi:hypothetical protein
MNPLKKLLVFACLFCNFVARAQAPQAITYQAVARDNSGNPIASQNIALRFSIRDISAAGTIVYRETHLTSTNSEGLFNVNLGQGTVVTGVFSSINWGTNSKFLQVEIDITGGTAFTDMGTQQMLSVPYALYSGSSSGNAGGDLSGQFPNPAVTRINGSLLGTTTGASNGQVLKWNGSSWSPGTDNGSGGTVTSVTAGTGLSGGTITTSGTISLPNVGTAGTYGSATLIPVITTDAQGRVSGVSTASATSGWSLTGNNNTTDGTHFIGTTNGVALNFKVNDQKAGRIDFVFPKNTFYGYQSGLAVTTGRDNTASGYTAFSSNTTGNENTAFGSSALFNNVAAWGNTAIGYNSQYFSNNSPSASYPYNTSVGHNSLRGSGTPANNTGTINTAIGGYTLYNNTSGSNNTALGFQALTFNTTGGVNTATGFNALYSNTSGSYNTAYGPLALYSNTTGTSNTALGNSALYSSTAGSYGVAIGENSQYYAYDGPAWNNFNTSVGFSALRGSPAPANNTGLFNTAIGTSTLINNASGSYNTATGHEALSSNSTASFNTATGYQVLKNNTGQSNTGSGYQALFANTTGIRNTAYGEKSLFSNSTGTDNVAVGPSTLILTTLSNYNTAIGAAAGAIHNHGGFNTFVGHSANTNAAGLSNSTALGDNAVVSASNQVRIGNAVTSIGGPQDWSNTSDGRVKLGVREDIPGLAFIRLLKPVSYTKSIEKEYEITGVVNERILTEDNTYEKMRHTGFIAQEVENAAREIGYDFSGVDAPKNNKDLYSLRYAVFVVPLVKAVQEQQALIESQNKVIAEIQKENKTLKSENLVFKNDIETIKQQLGLDVKTAATE